MDLHLDFSMLGLRSYVPHKLDLSSHHETCISNTVCSDMSSSPAGYVKRIFDEACVMLGSRTAVHTYDAFKDAGQNTTVNPTHGARITGRVNHQGRM